jgi:UDP-N-acetylglucosamine--N-acetylmuramyl-(pentapeptide) pyrophosphoryl-undecaprenol N-acetylglucosamine transferase
MKVRVGFGYDVHALVPERDLWLGGVTNKHLAAKAKKICVAYDGMERFFPADKIINTGNPTAPARP